MDKGQHLRLVIMGNESTPLENYVASATDLTVHFSAQTEDSTTKDTTDTTGSWMEYDVTGRNGDIQFGARLSVLSGERPAGLNSMYLEDFIDKVNDVIVNWKLLFVAGNANRVKVKTLCSGQGKLTNLTINGQNRQNAAFTGTLNMFGPVTVGTD